jgi:hypothetical protein
MLALENKIGAFFYDVNLLLAFRSSLRPVNCPDGSVLY